MASIAGAASIHFDFEADSPFQVVAGGGTAAIEADQPLSGRASLRLELPANANEMTLVSAPFPVRPFRVYELRWKTRLDRGTEVRARLRMESGRGSQDIFATSDHEAEIHHLHTLPGVKEARLVLWMRVVGQALGRTVTLDDIELIECGPLKAGQGQEMFFNGSFEIPGCWPPPGWGFWGQKPGEYLPCAESPYDGTHCLRTRAADYVVLPLVYVRDRDFVHLRLWLRGKGTVHMGAHHLNRRQERVGWSNPLGSDVIALEENAWRPVDFLMAGVGGACYLQAILMPGRAQVDVDAISVQRVRREFKLTDQ